MNAYTVYTKKGAIVTSHYNFLANDEYDARQYAFTRKAWQEADECVLYPKGFEGMELARWPLPESRFINHEAKTNI